MMQRAAIHIDRRAAERHFDKQISQPTGEEAEVASRYTRAIRMNTMVQNLLEAGRDACEQTEVHAQAAVETAREAGGMHLIYAQQNLMHVLSSLEKHADATVVGREALILVRRIVGEKHPLSVSVLRAHAACVLATDNFPAAEALLRQAATSCRQVWGDEHNDTMMSFLLLGQVLAAQAKLLEAEAILRATLRMSTQVNGDFGELTLIARSNLSAVVQSQALFPSTPCGQATEQGGWRA